MKRGGGTGPTKPRQPLMRQTVPNPARETLGNERSKRLV